MKKLLFALAVLLPLFVQAQQEKSRWSLACRTGVGMSYCRALSTQNPPIGSAAMIAVGGKYDLNKGWSLLAGLEYQYHNNEERYSLAIDDLQGNLIDNTAIINIRSHNYRLPIMAEYHTGWFYVAFGLYYETCVYVPICYHYFACGGLCFDIGGRIPLSENNRLCIGLRPTLGVIYSPVMYDFRFEWEETSILSVSLEHRF